MRFFASLALAGVASATLVARQTVPTCALTCIASADLGGCSSTDNKCLCTTQSFISSTTACIESTCQGDDLQNAIAFAQQTCEAVGVTLTTPAATSTAPAGSSTSGASASTTASSSASSSASSTSTSAPASTSSSAAKSNSIPVVAGVAALFAAIAL